MDSTTGIVPKFRIPTLDHLGLSEQPRIGDSTATKVAEDWVQALSTSAQSQDVENIVKSLVCTDGLWRDVYALTWDIRTFDGGERIRPFLNARIPVMTMHSFKLKPGVRVQRLYPDVVWILLMFDFETNVGQCNAVVRLAPVPSAGQLEPEWKAFTVFTNLDNLTAFPELIGPSRNQSRVGAKVWWDVREEESSFSTSMPTVLIVGGGLSGLSLAARLKYLDVPTLVIEKDKRIGDSWRRRYDSLCLHFPISFDNMPYLPFPPTWPKYSPGLKMADWLEHYADILELNIWTSSAVLDAVQNEDETWKVRVQGANGTLRVFNVNHFILATGQGDGVPRMPSIPNLDNFKGEVIHSSGYKRASLYAGKKVVVIGTGNSGHDISADLAEAKIDVTMYQRSATFVMNLDKGWGLLAGPLYSETAPPNHVADQLYHSMPHLLLEGGLAQRNTETILAAQKDILDGLRSRGFKVNSGVAGAGMLLNLKQKGGGHYFDVGASQMIIDGSIKIKNDSTIKEYGELGLKFEDGSEVDADVVICATGNGDNRQLVAQLCGEQIAAECPPFLGVNEEGEMTWFRPFARKGFWYVHGPLSITRFHSKHVAICNGGRPYPISILLSYGRRLYPTASGGLTKIIEKDNVDQGTGPYELTVPVDSELLD